MKSNITILHTKKIIRNTAEMHSHGNNNKKLTKNTSKVALPYQQTKQLN